MFKKMLNRIRKQQREELGECAIPEDQTEEALRLMDEINSGNYPTLNKYRLFKMVYEVFPWMKSYDCSVRVKGSTAVVVKFYSK
jgi:hypothetical protein